MSREALFRQASQILRWTGHQSACNHVTYSRALPASTARHPIMIYLYYICSYVMHGEMALVHVS